MNIEVAEMDSPVGRLTLAVRNQRLVALCFEGLWARRLRALERHLAGCRFASSTDPARLVSRLRDYFDGNLAALAEIEVETWGTPFQQSVWTQLRLIPPGQTRTYAAIAHAIGLASAVRTRWASWSPATA